MNAQNRDLQSNIGKEGDASIRLIDTALFIFEDKSNSPLKFEIFNKNNYPIYIPQPELKKGTIPQYFDLHNKSVECDLEFTEMIPRSVSEFILIPSKSSKVFQLNKDFFKNSCLRHASVIEAVLVYRASNFEEEDGYFTFELMKKDRDSRDIVEYFLTTTLQSLPIKIIYK